MANTTTANTFLVRKAPNLGVQLKTQEGNLLSVTAALEDGELKGFVTPGWAGNELWATVPTGEITLHIATSGIYGGDAVEEIQLITSEWEVADPIWIEQLLSALGGLEQLIAASTREELYQRDLPEIEAKALEKARKFQAAQEAARQEEKAKAEEAKAAILALAKKPIPKGKREQRIDELEALRDKYGLSHREVAQIARKYL